MGPHKCVFRAKRTVSVETKIIMGFTTLSCRGRRPSRIVLGWSVLYKCHMCQDFYNVHYGHGVYRFRGGRPNVVRDTCDAGGRITYKSLCIYTTHARRIINGVSESRYRLKNTRRYACNTYGTQKNNTPPIGLCPPG